MIPPLVLPCDACGLPFLASLADLDDDAILCNACWTPPDRESLDGLADHIFELGGVLERAYRELFTIKIIGEE